MKWLIIFPVVICILIAGGLGYYTYRITPFLSQKLRDQILRSSDSLYHVDFSSLRINPFTGSMTLTAFRVIPDTAVYNRMKQLRVAPENVFDLYVPQVELKHAHPIRLLFFRKVKISDVKIEYPVIKINHEDLFLSDRNQTIQKTMANLIAGPLKAIQIGRLDLDNINLTYKNKSNPSGKGFQLEKADLILRDLSIDRNSVADTMRLLYARDCWVHMVNFDMPTADSLYRLKMNDVVYSVRSGKVLVKGLALTPRYDEDAFDRRTVTQRDRYDLLVDSVTLSGFKLLDILRQKKIGRVSRVRLDGIEADIYHNRELPPATGVKPLPQYALRKAAGAYIFKNVHALFTIDTLSWRRAHIVYRERSRMSRRIGVVSFNQLNGTFLHVSDDPAVLAAGHRSTGEVHGLFMNKAEADVRFVFDLSDPANGFSYEGSLAPMKATVLNKATRYLGLLKIRSGNIRQLRFRFSADSRQTTGSVLLRYDELSISILSLDELSGRLEKKGLASLVANLLVLRNNNVTDTSAKREAHITYPRDPEKSVFNYMWKSIFKGVKEIVGMDEDVSKLKKDFQQNNLVKKIREKKAAQERR